MPSQPHAPIAASAVTPAVAALVGLAALAAAMGVGRFAFTPLLPLMQRTQGLSLTDGAWLASANYIGYFIGAVASFVLHPRPGQAARWGLLAVALATLAMAATTAFAPWLVLRAVAGVGSAFVLVGASAWALSHLTATPRVAGWVFAGVGIGLIVTGLMALWAGAAQLDPLQAWLALGVLCAVVTALVWRPLARDAAAAPAHGAATAPPLNRAEWTLVACYGAFGFGYILPATFIPAAARALVDDPAVFGWTWPLFGLAAALSTVVVSSFAGSAKPRRVAIVSLLVMALGVAAPALQMSLGTLLFSALAVGGTFMVMTMAGTQEARRIAAGAPAKLIAALTAAFAIGQIMGPVLVGSGPASGHAFVRASALAAAVLLLSAIVLHATRPRDAHENPPAHPHRSPM